MKWIAALTVSVPLLLGQTAPRASLSVVAVRHWSLSGVTRVAIEVTGEFEFRTDHLHNPERVYYDILNAAPHVGAGRGYSEPVADPILKKIRVAETHPGITRVVLDLDGPVEATTSTLANPNRLIVELHSGPAPAISTEPPVAATRTPANPPLIVKPDLSVVKPPAVPAAAASQPAASGPSQPQTPASFVPEETTKPARRTSPGAPPPTTAGASSITEEAARSAERYSSPLSPPVTAPPPPEETAKGARHTSSGESSLIRTLGLKINRVVIDPGHGGHDQGTEGVKGLLEKDLVLDVAKRLGKMVEDRMGAEVIYTRTDDTFIPLEGRTALANEKKADLFLSIHANSSSLPRIAGVETFYLNISGSHDAMDVAARENAASSLSVFELQDIIRKIAMHDKSTESQEFAHRIQTALYGFSTRNIPAKDRGVKSAPFIVLKDALMPSVLAEIGFLTNVREEMLLKKSDYRDKLADALYKGIFAYSQGLSHVQVAAKP